MADTLSHSNLLPVVSEIISAQIGLHFPRERWRDLERGLAAAARELGFNDRESYLHSLIGAPLDRSQVEVLARHLTIGETYFFRERRTLEILQERILPELIRARRGGERTLRLWSAGCCTGEEPYSLAILLSEMLPDLDAWHLTILGTDMNPAFLHKATEGAYTEWSFRDAPAWVKQRYFTPRGAKQFRILSRIRAMVNVAYLNLAEDPYPSLLNNTHAMDVILCRNVLMYFSAEGARKVVERLQRALVEGGWLLVSASEAACVDPSLFVRVDFPGAILFRKDSAAQQQAARRHYEQSLPRTAPGDHWEALAPSREATAAERLVSCESAGRTSRTTPHRPRPLPPPSTPVPASPPSFAAAVLRYQRGDYAQAVARASELLTVHCRGAAAAASEELFALLARARANEGKLGEALQWCDRGIAAAQLNASLHYLRAAILQAQGELPQAEESLKRALYLDPDFVLAHFALGNLARRQSKARDAGKHFANALSLLHRLGVNATLPEADGMTAGRLREIIQSTMDASRA